VYAGHGAGDTLEVRADDGDEGPLTIVGHAAVFDRKSEELGAAGWFTFREQIKRGAFKRALDEDQDVRLLWEHDPRWILARTAASQEVGRLELSEDPRGLRSFAKVVPTSYARDLEAVMRAGVVTQMSFGFTVGPGGDEWLERTRDDGTVEVLRTIHEVERLFDVSVVAFPAYPQTDAVARSLLEPVFAGGEGPDLEQLRAVALKVHRGEVEASATLRAAIDHAFSGTDSVSPWTAQRALRAVAQEPELRGAVHEPGEAEDGGEGGETDPVGGRDALAARQRRLRLMELTS
jgi:HK97 family phage prohead protease